LSLKESGERSHLCLVGEFDRAAVGRVERALEHVSELRRRNSS
jgi:hypothetical protein